jgi:succinate dehydrogenase hydrophobic anchor subunit
MESTSLSIFCTAIVQIQTRINQIPSQFNCFFLSLFHYPLYGAQAHCTVGLDAVICDTTPGQKSKTPLSSRLVASFLGTPLNSLHFSHAE